MAGRLLCGYGRDGVVVAAGPDDVDLPHSPAIPADLGGHNQFDQEERDDAGRPLPGRWSYLSGRRRVVGSPV